MAIRHCRVGAYFYLVCVVMKNMLWFFMDSLHTKLFQRYVCERDFSFWLPIEEPTTGIFLCPTNTHAQLISIFHCFIYMIPGLLWRQRWGNLLGTRERFGSKIWRFNQDFNFSSFGTGGTFFACSRYVQKGMQAISLHSPALHASDYLLSPLKEIL